MMQTLILKQDTGIVLTAGDKIGAGSEALELRFSLIDFYTTAKSQLRESFHEKEELPIRKFHLTPGEAVIFAPGEKITPANEPLKICFGEIDFTTTGRSVQEQITASVALFIRCAIPTAWHIESVKYIKNYAEQIDKPVVLVIPSEITWERSAKGRQYRKHVVDVAVIGKLDTDKTVNILDQWAELLLDAGGPFEHACMEAVPLDIAEAGYSIEALTNTPSLYLGGLRLTFWEL